jgi:hypothetical protein
VRFSGHNEDISNSLININKDVTYISMTGLQLSDDVYTTRVSAVNYMFLRSDAITTNVTVHTPAPLTTGRFVSNLLYNVLLDYAAV